ncbi:MAG: patatin-like phospholipase family protein [Haloarculaceae archaeon]
MTNVAIACQGGGSHTAFTGGVLAELLPEFAGDGHELVGLSGTSGGAMSAAAAWYAYLDGGPAAVPEAVESLWTSVAARAPADRALNTGLVSLSRARAGGAPFPEVSPYVNPATEFGRARLREVIEEHVDFDRIPDLLGPESPRLVVGTVDINGGCFEAFVDGDVTADVLLASSAVPDLFEAVEMNGHWHWDGLFSQNPPIHELMEVSAARKPDELWVVQINPQTRDGEPRSLFEIGDRRNELSGNLSLNQELRFIETVNEWVDEGKLDDEEHRHVEVRRIEFGRRLSCSSKLDRSPEFLGELFEAGRERARAFHDSL